ncbi:MAG: hypothetical protein KDK27_18110, partial [Leptospiraceae bacterium]|nr:hypothetical protein [Leptospiraceae bacterium]
IGAILNPVGKRVDRSSTKEWGAHCHLQRTEAPTSNPSANAIVLGAKNKKQTKQATARRAGNSIREVILITCNRFGPAASRTR